MLRDADRSTSSNIRTDREQRGHHDEEEEMLNQSLKPVSSRVFDVERLMLMPENTPPKPRPPTFPFAPTEQPADPDPSDQQEDDKVSEQHQAISFRLEN